MESSSNAPSDHPVTLFLCGDVMTGRGIDQILSHPSDPTLYERSVKDARRYVELAERQSGSIPRNAENDYIWGRALDILDRVSPDLRIVNLETAVTTSDEPWPNKAIHYRMHPKNVPCLTAADLDCCVLANNHVLDWGHAGLRETRETLESAGIDTVGIGRLDEAQRPAVLQGSEKPRVLLFAAGSTSSGIPSQWAATEERPGVHLIDETSPEDANRIEGLVAQYARPSDLVVFSIHWGSNWGYDIPSAQRHFAHALIDEAGVDVVHGHSSHHVKGVEVYRNRPILYGCGDFLTDYEGISGREQYRDDLGVMYFHRIDPASHELERLEMHPTHLRRFQIAAPSAEDVDWLADVLERQSRRLNTRVQQMNGTLAITEPG